MIEKNNFPQKYYEQLESLIQQNLGDVFPAAAIYVVHQGECVLHGAWGWVDPETQRIPVKTGTLFDLASVTKLFVETAFLAQVSAGKIGLDDPLVRVIPEFGEESPRQMDGGQDPHSKEQLVTPDGVKGKTIDPTTVTFRQLMTHTSGLAAWRDVFNAAGQAPVVPDQVDPIPPEERWAKALKALCHYPFVGEPNEKVVYSDIGLMLLGETVARLYGKGDGLNGAVRNSVLEPLQLEDVTYNPMQHGYERDQIVPTENDPTWRKRRCWGEVHDENACGVGGIAGHAGLFGTVQDVGVFGQAWLERDQRLRIGTEWMNMATREQAISGASRHGLGWMLKSYENSSAGEYFSSEAYGHTGFTGTSLWIDPKRELVVATMTNRVYPGREKVGIHAFRRALHDLIAQGVDR
jgi:CubicO group peptidase (beta-lactamase class C family)